MSWSAHGHLWQECCAVGGGDQATDQAPMTCRPNAAQLVVPGGLRAHTRETASPSPRGGGGPCRKWSRCSASPPNPCPSGVPAAWHVVRARGQEEETKRRAAAMMLSRTGRDREPPLGRGQTDEGRRAPWGCAAGAPYRGTASPPPPPPPPCGTHTHPDKACIFPCILRCPSHPIHRVPRQWPLEEASCIPLVASPPSH